MKMLKSEVKLCLSCMEERKVDIVEVVEHESFKGVEVDFPAIYEHCSKSDEYFENEDMIRMNSLAFKDAYREKVGKLDEEKMLMLDVYSKLAEAEKQLVEGKVLDGEASLKRLREKYKE